VGAHVQLDEGVQDGALLLPTDLDDWPWRRPSCSTDIEGRFKLTGVEDGAFRLLVGKEGFTTKEPPPVVRGGATGIEIVLLPSRRITGWVLDSKGEAYLGEFLVEAWSSDRTRPVITATPSASGFFELRGVHEGEYTLVARPVHEEWEREKYAWCAVKPAVPARARGVRLPLQPTPETLLDLRDAKDTRLVHADVWLRGPHVDRYLWADEDGVFFAQGVPPGRYTFLVVLADGSKHTVEVEAGKTATYIVK